MGHKNYIFSLKNHSTLKSVGKAQQGRISTFPASLRTIPASDFHKKIYLRRYKTCRFWLSSTVATGSGSYGPTGQTFSAQRSTSKPSSRVRFMVRFKYNTVLLPS